MQRACVEAAAAIVLLVALTDTLQIREPPLGAAAAAAELAPQDEHSPAAGGDDRE